MERLFTLNDFINDQITKYSLRRNKKNQKKLRIYFTRILKTDPVFRDRNVWESAPTIPIAKTRAKQFSQKDLQLLLNKSKNYLSKIAKKEHPNMTVFIDKKVKENSENLGHMREEKIEDDAVIDDELRLSNQTNDYIEKIMLKAIFEHFYTPIDIKKVKRDIAYQDNIFSGAAPPEYETDRTILAASYRLDHPAENYFKPKNNNKS